MPGTNSVMPAAKKTGEHHSMDLRGSDKTPAGSLPVSRSSKPHRPLFRRTLFWVQVLLVLGIIIGAWLSLRSTVQDPVMAAPSHIGDMKRVSVLTGEAAMEKMRAIHPRDI